jgi:hypothetical protein
MAVFSGMSKKHGPLTSRKGTEAAPGRLKFSEDAIQVTPDGAIAIDPSKLETPAISSCPAISDLRLAPHAVVEQREFAGSRRLSPELREKADRARLLFRVLPLDDVEDPDYGF